MKYLLIFALATMFSCSNEDKIPIIPKSERVVIENVQVKETIKDGIQNVLSEYGYEVTRMKIRINGDHIRFLGVAER